MRVAAYRLNGKLLGEFVSISEAARVLNLDPFDILEATEDFCIHLIAKSGPQEWLGYLRFQEVDYEKRGNV